MMVFMRKGLPEESNRINNGQAGKIKGQRVEGRRQVLSHQRGGDDRKYMLSEGNSLGGL